MIWSKLRKQLEERIYDELKGRVKFISDTYRKQHDTPGRVAILIDNIEVFDMSTLKWSNKIDELESEKYKEYDKGNKYLSTYEESKRELEEIGIVPQWDFYNRAHEFLNMNIEDAINLNNKIINILAVMDRRVGKRSLQKLKDKFNNDLDIILKIIDLRLENI